MSVIQDDFNTRVEEIEKYFAFLKNLEDDIRILANQDFSMTIRLDDDHVKIFKANGFLLLYNLIESTILNSVVAIFDEINVKGITYKDLSREVKKYWFKYKYKHDENINEENLYNKFYTIVEGIITDVTLDAINKLEYGGSIDHRRMKDIAESLGVNFKDPPNYNHETHGKTLIDIKKHRNQLAHGNISFANLGKDFTYYGTINDVDGTINYTSLGLQHYKQFTIEHLQVYITCVESYIANEQFKSVI